MSKKQEETTFVGAEETISKVEKNLEENKQKYIIIASVIVAIAAGIYSWNSLYVTPLEQDAQSKIFFAEKYFALDSLEKAMYGDGQHEGFADVIDNFGVTKTANLSNYYMGIGHLKKGEYNEAIEYLKDFNSDDILVGTISLGAIGDAYSELENYNEAISYYLKAANRKENKFTTPIYLMKAGLVYEELNELDNALKTYEKVKKEYPDTQEGREVEKYIGRVKAQSGK